MRRQNKSTVQKRVGASVAIRENPNQFAGPLGPQMGGPFLPYGNPPGPIGGPGPFLPPVPPCVPPFPPVALRGCPGLQGKQGEKGDTGATGAPGRVEDIGVAASVNSQTIAASTTDPLILSGPLFSSGGAVLSGNSLQVSKTGKYQVNAVVNLSKAVANPALVTLTATGLSGVPNPAAVNVLGVIANDRRSLNTSFIVNASALSAISFSVTNSDTLNPITVTGGTVSIQLLA